MQEILFPVLTGLSLVFAGILVGYFLWFRDRNEQLELSQRLSQDNESLASRIQKQTGNLVELKDQIQRQSAKNENLQQLCDDLLSSREKALLHSNELETELYSARCKLDQAREQVTSECRLRAKSEETLHIVKQQYLDSVVNLEKEWQNKYSESQSLLSRHGGEAQRLSSLYEQTAEKLHLANANVAELQSELNAQQKMLDTATKNAAGLEKEYVTLESSMRSQIELLNESRGQAAAAVSAKKLTEESLEEIRKQVSEQQATLREMEQISTKAKSLQAQYQTLEQSLENERARSATLTDERDQARQSFAALKKRSNNQETTIKTLRNQLDEQQDFTAKIRELESARIELSNESGSLTQRIADLESLRLKHETALKSVSDENARLLTKLETAEQNEAAAAIADEAKRRLDAVLRQRDNALEQIQMMTGELSRMRNHAKSNEETIRNLRRERGAVLMRNRKLQEQFPRIHAASVDEDSAMDQLTREYGGTARLDSVRGAVFVESPRVRDDLKRIFGVAKVLEQKLNEFGIYTFKQIMDWDNKAVQKFSELLIFKDRIYRDDWLGQARRLYEEKHRRNVA